MENITKHKDIKLVTNRESYLETVMKPNFKSAICLSPKGPVIIYGRGVGRI